LSYTSFLITDAIALSDGIGAAQPLHVSVKVKNTGARAGAEVVQLYIGFPNSKIDRPEKLLRGFKKVFLQPNEERLLEFTIPAADLAYYKPSTKTWEVENGKYEVLIGNSSLDAKMPKAAFELK
jgi:beta-glucosidase